MRNVQASIWAKWASFFLESSALHWWWVLFFVVLALAWYEHGNEEYAKAYHRLNDQLLFLQREKETALDLQTALQQQLHSYNDSAWMEMVLMRKLGVVSEKQTKVYFRDCAVP